jgi:outer membrane protein OmpA-like peptidoglycan-associated protein
MVSVCPQQHPDSERLTSRLLTLRWQISQLRKETGHSVPLVLSGQVGSAMTNDMLWQAAIPGEGVRVWRASSAPSSIAAWVTTGGSPAMQQQVLMNSLMGWFHQHVKAVFMDDNPDIPVIAPTTVLWGMGPILSRSLATSAWTAWLSRHTAMQQVTGWQPVGTDSTVISPFPDFILPLLPEGRGLTPRGRTWRCALGIFTLATLAALLSSGWNNGQLLQRVGFDIARYDRIPMNDFGPKADAVAVLRDDAAQLDEWSRNGVPARMSLGLYQGGHLRMPVLDAIRSYVPPPPPPKTPPKIEPVPKIIRLDSMSLFDSGKSVLKTGSTKMLVNSLVGIKAKPGWLIVVSGHTDNTGNPQLNQMLSLKRAEAVRDWMRDTGDVPESCFAVQGYGESRPVATNDTPDGRALNRRVEISLVPHPLLLRGVDFGFPKLFTGGRINGNYVVMRRTEEEFIANLQRRLLIFSAAAVRAQRNITRAISPGYLQIFHVIAGDLVQGYKARGARGVAVIRPVDLFFTGLHFGERQWLTRCGNRSMRHKHACHGACKGHNQHGGNCASPFPARSLTGATEQQRQRKRHQDGDAGQR